MQYRELGSSGIQASIVGLGTFAIGGWFWGGADEAESIAAIHAAVDAGINLIDTAPIYGFGISEETVGKAVADRRDKVLIATKCGLVWDKEEGEFFAYADDQSPSEKPAKYKVFKNQRPDMIQIELESSLRRMNTDYIDLYQTHWQDGTTPIADTMEKLLRLKEQGKIRAIGVSNVTIEQLEEYGNGVDSAQEKYSLLDRTLAENGTVDYCSNHDISILSYFTLEQGLLTGKLSSDRKFKPGDMRGNNTKFSTENRKKVIDFLHQFDELTVKYSCTTAQLMLALTAQQRGITHLLAGARNERQAAENGSAGSLRLETGDVDTMNAAFKLFLAAQ